jgi:hypothetical protein
LVRVHAYCSGTQRRTHHQYQRRALADEGNNATGDDDPLKAYSGSSNNADTPTYYRNHQPVHRCLLPYGSLVSLPWQVGKKTRLIERVGNSGNVRLWGEMGVLRFNDLIGLGVA